MSYYLDGIISCAIIDLEYNQYFVSTLHRTRTDIQRLSLDP